MIHCNGLKQRENFLTKLPVIWHLTHLSQGAWHLSLHRFGTSVLDPRLNDRRRGPPLILAAVHSIHLVHAAREKSWHGQKYFLGTAALRCPRRAPRIHACDLLPPLLDQSARLAEVHCEAVAQLGPRDAPALPAGRKERLSHMAHVSERIASHPLASRHGRQETANGRET